MTVPSDVRSARSVMRSPENVRPYFIARQIDSRRLATIRDEIEHLETRRNELLSRTAAEIADLKRQAAAEIETARELACRAEVEAVRAEVASLLQGLRKAQHGLLTDLDQRLPSLVVDLARKVVRRELAGPRGDCTWAALLSEAIKKLRDADELALRVAPGQVAMLQGAVVHLRNMQRVGPSIEVIADESVSDGACVIRSATGSIEVSVERAFEQAARQLTQVSLGSPSQPSAETTGAGR